jgi:hypothetical protein
VSRSELTKKKQAGSSSASNDRSKSAQPLRNRGNNGGIAPIVISVISDASS